MKIAFKSDDSNVIRPKFGAPALLVDRENDAPFCNHTHLWIQERRGVVICRAKNCGAEVNPIKVLVRMASDWNAVTYRTQQLEQIEKQVASLKRERSRLLAAIRKLEKATFHGEFEQ